VAPQSAISTELAGAILSVSSFNSVFTDNTLGTVHSPSSSLGAPTTVANGTITIGASIAESCSLRYTGSGEVTDRVLNFSFNSGSGHSLDASNPSGLLKFTSAITGSRSGGTPVLTLTGTGSGELAGLIPEIYVGFPITKSGTGTWTFSGPNSYTGPTTINEGRLFINGNQELASGPVYVIPNATLGGTGIIGGDTTIYDGGKLEFTISTNAANHDKLELASGKSLNFLGNYTLTINSNGVPAPGIYTLITAPGGITMPNSPTVNLPANWTADAPTNSGNDLVINITSTSGGGGGSPANPAQITKPSAGVANINFFGAAGTSYIVETTTNLNTAWTPLSTNLTDGSGAFLFIDSAATNAQQFYRLTQP
jgi:fibronectin-binding autotransporter adhesin